MPEEVWKSYIEFEIENGENAKVRQLYTLLLDRSSHVKVWVSYASWLFKVNKRERDAAREVFKQGYQALKKQGLSEERLMLLEKWLEIDPKNKKEIQAMMPKKVKKRRATSAEEAEEEGWEEYYDYVFPDEIDSS